MNHRKALNNNGKGAALMVASSLFACTGQLLWKLSAGYGLIAIAAGFLLYGIGALFMLSAYRYGSLSSLQPILALSYALSLVLAVWLLDEPLTLLKAAGVAVITAGVILVGGSDQHA